MRSVLIIAAPPMFREFLRTRLSDEKIDVHIAESYRDALTKFLSVLPSLVIINVEHSISDIIEFLEKKQSDPNGKHIPVIVSGPSTSKEDVAELVQYGVIKYFTRPIKFDLFFESVGHVLHSDFSVDTTPSVLDIHLSNDIIFIEVAEGLNREKIMLLRYKLPELIDANQLLSPKIILMLTDLHLSFVDGLNLELLLKNVTSDKRVLKRNIKILSLDEFVRDYIEGHPLYSGIEVVKSLGTVLNSLVEGNATASVQEVISDKILTVSKDSDEGSLSARFHADSDADDGSEVLATDHLRVVIVDSDPEVQFFLSDVFKTIGASITVFSSSADFASKVEDGMFDLAILGMYMPELTGIDILKILSEQKITLPVIVYSKLVQKTVIVQALMFGASSYLVKPQKPEVIIQKALAVVNAKRRS